MRGTIIASPQAEKFPNNDFSLNKIDYDPFISLLKSRSYIVTAPYIKQEWLSSNFQCLADPLVFSLGIRLCFAPWLIQRAMALTVLSSIDACHYRSFTLMDPILLGKPLKEKFFPNNSLFSRCDKKIKIKKKNKVKYGVEKKCIFHLVWTMSVFNVSS